jgi:hypothetical protein
LAVQQEVVAVLLLVLVRVRVSRRHRRPEDHLQAGPTL